MDLVCKSLTAEALWAPVGFLQNAVGSYFKKRFHKLIAKPSNIFELDGRTETLSLTQHLALEDLAYGGVEEEEEG